MDEPGMYDFNDIGEISSMKDNVDAVDTALNENLIKFNQVQLQANTVIRPY
jgi:hypothetical protein